MIPTHSIAIIGGGFSGLATALNLFYQDTKPLQIHLIDRVVPNGKGQAYQDNSPTYLLNVPAGQMGIFNHEPAHFYSWLRQSHLPNSQPTDFVPRYLYGEYLTELLLQAMQTPTHSQIFLHQANITELSFVKERISVIGKGEIIEADSVILALGNFPPATLPLQDPSFYNSPYYFSNPWGKDCLKNLETEDNILLLGTGLTMVDLVMGLKASGHRGKITALSPRGGIPLPFEPDVVNLEWDLPFNASLLQLFHFLRIHMLGNSQSSSTWQSVARLLRPHVPTLWQQFSLRERRQFMRHLRHAWGHIRHRIPHSVYEQLIDLQNSSQFEVIAGRVLNLSLDHDQKIALNYRPRGQKKPQVLAGFSRVINCTGPQLDVRQLREPLLQNLLAQGLLLPDPLGLGIQADPEGAVLNLQGEPSRNLFVLGPLLRGMYWESTAVAEIRKQATVLAATLLKNLSLKE